MSRKLTARRAGLVAVLIAASLPFLSPAQSASSVITSTAGTGNNAYKGDGGPAVDAGLWGPRMIAFDHHGGYYIADTLHNVVRHVNSAGIITTVAGTGRAGYNGDEIPANMAKLSDPHSVDVDAAGNLYIGDPMNNRVRMVDTAGIIHTIAGTGAGGFSGDGGPATAAKLKNPKIAMVGPDGQSVYIADYENNRIRKVAPDGTISTFAGTGAEESFGDGGLARDAGMVPRNIVFDNDGDLLVADRVANTVRRIDLETGIVSHVAGKQTLEGGFSGDGGKATEALLNKPRGLGADWLGNVYIADSENNRVRRVSPDGIITTVAGNGKMGGDGDGDDPLQASLWNPRHAAFDDAGNLFITDTYSDRIRKVDNFIPPRPAPTTPTTTTPTTTTPTTGTPTTTPTPVTPSGTGNAARSGYWMLGSDGAIFAFGEAKGFGDAKSLGDAVDLEPTPTGHGYWVTNRSGRVAAFGDAKALGGVPAGGLLTGETVTSLSSTPAGDGYWLFTDRGRAVPVGSAHSYGDLSAMRLNAPVLDSIPTSTGRGYFMVAGDGGIFAFGDARFAGSMGDKKLNAPVQSLVPDPDGKGYWLVASDGGVFAFDAPFRGSMGGTRLAKPVTGMVPYGNGYLMVGEDGGAFNFSDQPFSGSLGGRPPARPIVAVAALG